MTLAYNFSVPNFFSYANATDNNKDFSHGALVVLSLQVTFSVQSTQVMYTTKVWSCRFQVLQLRTRTSLGTLL